jgi:hypothetical protein
MRVRFSVFVAAVFALGGGSFSQARAADAIQLKTGQLVYGDIASATETDLVMVMDYGVHRYRMDEIARISADDGKVNLPDAEREKSRRRFPSWRAIYGRLIEMPWGADAHQAPAAVITEGVLNGVPYTSYRSAGGGYEVNIYGDPDEPAAVEVGVYDGFVGDVEAQRNCRDFIAGLLDFPPDADAVMGIDPAGGRAERGNLRIEITPPGAPGSYGGWWVLASRPKALEATRATPGEITVISEPVRDARKGEAGWTREEMKEFRGTGEDLDRVFDRGFYRNAAGKYASGSTNPEPKSWWQRVFGR